MTVIDVDRGTDERRWRECQEMGTWPSLDLTGWVERRVVVLAAHPDDEVLAIGGTLALLARRGVQMTFIWATDGEASHPGSIAAAKLDLSRIRIAETQARDHVGVAHPPTLCAGVRSRLFHRPDNRSTC